MDALTTTEDTVDELPTYLIHESLLDEVTRRVDTVNRRLARAGSNERFTFTAVPTPREEHDAATGMTAVIPLVTVTISAPTIRSGEWDFVATLVQEPAGMIVRTVPGQDLSTWQRPDSHTCDYCGKARTRTRSYVVRNTAGEFKQIGSNCLAPFLGVAPAGLWTLTYDQDELIGEEYRAGGAHTEEVPYPIRALLALAWVISHEGRKFVTRGAAAQLDGVFSTADDTTSVWHWKPYGQVSREYQAWVERMRHEAREVPTEVIDELLAVADDLSDDTDYGQNMHVALASENISRRSVGLVTSLIAVYNRKMQRIAERESRPQIVDEWLGEVKGKLTDLPVTLTQVMEVEGWAYDSTDTLVIMRADSGHLLKWKASGEHRDLTIGQRHTLVRATVKKHDVYRDTKQTVVTRCKLVPLPDDA